MNFGDMQKQSWSLTNEGDVVEDVANNDDDDDVQNGNNTFYVRNASLKTEDDDDDQQPTLKPEKTARQTMLERKINQADIRGQTLKYPREIERQKHTNKISFNLDKQLDRIYVNQHTIDNLCVKVQWSEA